VKLAAASEARPGTAGTARLVLRLSSLGDLVLCSAFARALREEAPDARLFFWVDASLVPLVENFGAGFECLPFARGPASLARAFAQGWRLRRRLGAEGLRLEHVYDLHGVGKSAALRAGLRLADVFSTRWMRFRSHRTRKSSLLRSLSVLFRRDLLGARHVYREHLGLLGRDDLRPSLVLAAPVARAPRSILIAPDASKWKKKWPVEHWSEFLRRLLADPRAFTLTLVGPPKAFPTDLVDELAALGGERFRDRLGQTRLDELPAIAAAHALTLCGNSAWLHISEAVGTPVLALAGPIVPGFGFSPWRAESRELGVPLPCRPCTRHGGGPCTYPERHACMKRVSPGRLWEAFEGWWTRYGDSR